jgi:uncharacterized iron-regulated protein
LYDHKKPAKEKPMSKPLVLIFMVLVLLTGTGLAEDTDLLPLGTSPHRYKIGKVGTGEILYSTDNTLVTVPEIVSRTKDTNVYIIGESHTSYDCHKFQTDFISALFEKYPKLVVGFEFFSRSDNEILEKWRLGKITEDELLRGSGWFTRQSYHFGYTRMIMNLIRDNKIKTIGLNVPRDLLRQASRKGFQTLSQEEKSLFPTIDIPNPDHRFLIQRVFGSFAAQVPMWFNRVYTSQKMWDVIMAESMIRELAKYPDYKGIIIAGNFHVVYKLGIPFRYQLTDTKARITTLVPVYLEEEKDEEEEENPMMKMLGQNLKEVGIFSRGIGDFVYAVDKKNDDYYKKIGIKGKIEKGQFHVQRVVPGSKAEEYGLRKGDIIQAVDGEPIRSIEDFEYQMYRKFGKKELAFDITRTVGESDGKEHE